MVVSNQLKLNIQSMRQEFMYRVSLFLFLLTKKLKCESSTILIKKISDVLDKSRLSLENCDLRLAGEIAAHEYKNVILQNRETNFVFINRIVKNINRRFWIIDTMPQAEILIDDCVNKAVRTIKKIKLYHCEELKSAKIRK